MPPNTETPAICGSDGAAAPCGPNDCRLVAVLTLLAIVLLTSRTPFPVSVRATPPPA